MVYGLSQADSEADIWEAFDEAVAETERSLSAAQQNSAFIARTDEPLPEVYRLVRQELETESETFDSVYEVTEAELEQVRSVATRATLLASVTDAFRTYHESVIDTRVGIAGEWFDTLETTTEEAGVTVAADRPKLLKQRKALQKLVDAEKYDRLLESERVQLDRFETGVEKFDAATRDALDAGTYVIAGADLVASLRDRYTDILAELVEHGVDRSAISVADRISETPDVEPIAERATSGSTTPDDAEVVGSAIGTYATVARMTGRRYARYELGENLIAAVEETPLFDDDVEADLSDHLAEFDVSTIESRITTLLENEVVVSDDDRFQRLLAEHDGSLRRTAQTMDEPTDELFDRLQDLYEAGELADIKAKFE